MGDELAEPGFSTQYQALIKEQATEFIFQRFANKWFLAITQFKGLPNIYTISFDQKVNDRILPKENDALKSVHVHTECNFGTDLDEVRASLQFLINNTKLNRCPVDLICSFGLKQIKPDILREIVNILNEQIL